MLELKTQKIYPDGSVLKTESIDNEYCFVLYDSAEKIRRIWNTRYPICADAKTISGDCFATNT